MNTFLVKHKWFVGLVALAFLLLLLKTWWLTAETRGQLDARYDLWRGHYAVHTYGLDLSGGEYARILRDRYGIETHIDAFCVVSKEQISYADGYNKLSRAAANRKFGHDVFEECGQVALREWETRGAQILETK
jgi:hypothetical protein